MHTLNIFLLFCNTLFRIYLPTIYVSGKHIHTTLWIRVLLPYTVLCDCRIHNDWASRSASSPQRACPLYSFRAAFFLAKHHITQICQPPLQPRFGSLRLLAFPKPKFAFEREEICECNSHTVHKLSQWRLTADWLAPRESDCSRMNSKVSSDWLPSYIKATWPVL